MGIKSKDKKEKGLNNKDNRASPTPCSVSSGSMIPSDAVVAGGGEVAVLVGAPGSRSPGPGSPTGYNSGDEYGSTGETTSSRPRWTPEQFLEMERRFEKILRKKGFLIMKMGEDGACLFRAVADQVYADENMHSLVRKLCCDYMTKNSDYFSQFITEDFNQYVSRKRRDHIQGNHVELQALSELFARPIEVYHYSSEPINIFQSGQDFEEGNSLPLESMEPIRISYHSNPGVGDCGHYNSVRPTRPGLFKPKICPLIHFTPPSVVETAIRNSEADALEKAMLEDKIRATDWEATNEALEEQVARESYLEWVRETEKRRKRSRHGHGSRDLDHAVASSSTAVTNTVATDAASGGSGSKASGSRSGSSSHSSRSPFEAVDRRHRLTHSFPEDEEEEEMNGTGHRMMSSPTLAPRSPSSLYYEELPTGPESERDILARVLLASRQEYLDSLKTRRKKSPSPPPAPNNRSGSRSPKNANRGQTPPPSSSRMSSS